MLRSLKAWDTGPSHSAAEPGEPQRDPTGPSIMPGEVGLGVSWTTRTGPLGPAPPPPPQKGDIPGCPPDFSWPDLVSLVTILTARWLWVSLGGSSSSFYSRWASGLGLPSQGSHLLHKLGRQAPVSARWTQGWGWLNIKPGPAGLSRPHPQLGPRGARQSQPLVLRTRGTLTRARGLRSRASSWFWAPGVSLRSLPPAPGRRGCSTLTLGRSPL